MNRQNHDPRIGRQVRTWQKALALIAALGMAQLANAATLTWDGNGSTAPNPNGGNGTWDTNSTANWWDGSTNVVWPALGGTDDDAVFGDTAGTVTISGGVTANDLTFNTTGYTVTASTLTLNGTTPTITAGSGISATINSQVSGSAGLLKSGTGTLTLGSANNYTGGTVISQGTLISGNATALSTGAITLGDGSTGANNVKLQFNANVNAGTIGNITVANTGSSGTATLGINTDIQVKTDLALSRDTVFASTGGTPNNQVFKGTISGTGAGSGNNSITVNSGAGNWLTQYVPTGTSNSYSGNLYIDTGNLQIGSYDGAGVSLANQNKAIPDTASVTIDSGSTLRFVWTSGAEAIDGLNGGGTIDRNTGDSQGNVNFTVGTSNGSGSFSGAITSQINLIKAGSGTQTLSGGNSYGGSTAVQNGVLALTTGSNRLPTGTTVTLGNSTDSGKLTLGSGGTAASQTVAGLLTSGTGTANAVVGGSTATSILTINNTGSHTFAGTLGGAGTNENNLALIKSGAGTLILTGTNTFTGNTAGPDYTGVRITGGTVSTDNVALNNNPSGIGGGSASLGLSGGTFKYTGAGGTLERRIELGTAAGSAIDASGTGALVWNNTGGFGGAGVGGARTLTLKGTSTSLNTMGVVIANPGNSSNVASVTKDGIGTWVLNQANTYTGTTTVNGGTLLVNGSHTGGGLYTVGTNGILGGTGSISASGLNVDGELAPGASVESLLVTAPVTFGSTSQLSVEIDESTAMDVDLLGITGNLTITSGAVVDFSVTGALTLPQYIFGTYTGTLTGAFTSSTVPAGYQLVQGGGELKLTLVPEPGTFAMLLFGSVMLWAVRRKRG